MKKNKIQKKSKLGDDLTKPQALILEIMWQSCSQKCRENCYSEYPEVIKIIEKTLGRKLEIA